MPHLDESTSKVIVDTENPHDDSKMIIKNCKWAKIVQKQWKRIIKK